MSPRARDEPVRLTRIYTRGGDGGETSLGDGTRVRKDTLRIEAIGAVDEANATLGEKIVLDRFAQFSGGYVAAYMHRTSPDLPPQVGVLVEYEGEDETAARQAAMQIAAMRPLYLSRDDVPAELVENERRIAEATAREEKKPEQALPRIVEGRVNSYFKDVALLDQPSVSDNKTPVSKVLDAAGIKVKRFVRFEAGLN